MVEETVLVLLVLALMLVTYLPRALPLQLNTSHWPAWFHDAVELIPPAIIAALVIPNLLLVDGELNGLSAELMAAVVTAMVSVLSRNLVLSVIVGTGAYMLLMG